MDFTTLLMSFGNTAYTVIVFIIALSIIVTVHEYGHYIVGRWSGIKADVFSLGFGKVIWSRKDKRGTVWQLAALPFGGYVKFAGDANAASAPDAHAVEGLSPDEARHTMPGAPLWARTLTVAAGPVFNFIFSALVFVAVLFTMGKSGDVLIVDEISKMPIEVGIEPGDEIVAIAGTPVPEGLEGYSDFIASLPHEMSLPYTVLRDGVEQTVEAPHPFPARIDEFSMKSAAKDAGLETGDMITAIDGVEVATFGDLLAYFSNFKGGEATLTVLRDGQTFEAKMTPRQRDLPLPEGGFETRYMIGIAGGTYFTIGSVPVSFGEAISAGVGQVWAVISLSLSAIYNMSIGAISACNLSGPVGIAQVVSSAASVSVSSFFLTIATLSTAIGLMNLFPIPVLDGGHLVFYAYEAVRGKPLPDRAVGVMMTVGLVVILSFMVLGLSADLFCV
ncbi:RIP metalloprotease RseP [Celeribacter baekdonensis]|uniref:Zinc metalloprotease n=1 Tax=Celeribacter baekdonensis B30 TaxID=1208323 RepID=K2K3H1_9RHOB|nr:RIP metalloprotease RseP [Celeribacter baekdonensis]EKE72035.1 peptidase M50 family protein [Celeribacter baekdonensis B30]